MDPRASDHVLVVYEKNPDVVKIARPEDMPAPCPPALVTEIRAAFILRQPDQWVVVMLNDYGARVGCGQLHAFTQSKPEGVN